MFQDDSFETIKCGFSTKVLSSAGILVHLDAGIEALKDVDCVYFVSGKGIRPLIDKQEEIRKIELDLTRQYLIGQCSGSALIAALGMLFDKKATTYPTSIDLLERFGAVPVNKPFVNYGNIAMAANCLASLYAIKWLLLKLGKHDLYSKIEASVLPLNGDWQLILEGEG